MKRDIINLVTELEDIILAASSKKDALHEGNIFLDKYGTIDNEGDGYAIQGELVGEGIC